MSVAVEHLSLVQEAFQISREHVGYVNPHVVSEVLTKDMELRQQITREIYRHKTRPFFYDGTEETITALLGEGDDFCVWSEDYFIRLATAGFGDIRRRLPFTERKRLFVRSAADKHALIPDILTYAQEHNLQHTIFIDNEEDSLQRAHKIVNAVGSSVDTSFVLAAPSNNAFPSSLSPDLPGTTIANIRDLLSLRTRTQAGQSHLWVADFNYTLVDTQALEQSRMESVATILRGHSY